jgi:hypothetical protein
MGIVSEAADNMHLQTKATDQVGSSLRIGSTLASPSKYGFGTRHKTSVGQTVCRDHVRLVKK